MWQKRLYLIQIINQKSTIKNGIKTDNRVSELEWNTSAENTQHAYQTGLKNVEQFIQLSKLKEKPIIQFNIQGDFIRTWQSATEASKELKISQGNISSCCRGERKTASGYKWKLKN